MQSKKYPYAIWCTDFDGDQFIFVQEEPIRLNIGYYIVRHAKYHTNPWRTYDGNNSLAHTMSGGSLSYGKIHSNPMYKTIKDIPTETKFEEEWMLENI